MEDPVATLARQFLAQMEPAERREALRSLKRIIDEGLMDLALAGGPESDDAPCPRCGSYRTVKKGRDRDGGQRRLCRSCGRTYTARTNRVLSTTKLDRATWMAFAECHIDMLTLRESAERCGVSLKTAFFMRHRILECISQSMPAFRSAAGDGMQVDELYLRESFKGNRGNAVCGIPREPHRRRCAVGQYEQICVLTGVNDAGDFFFEIVGRGSISEESAARNLEGKVASGAIVATDLAAAYRKPLAALDVRKHEAEPSRAHAINRVNSLHARIVEFVEGFHGVATRRLWNYLAWFKWIWSFRRSRTAGEAAELVVKQVAANPYKTTWRGYRETPYPFYDYWMKQAKWDATARAALPLARVSMSEAG